MDGECIPVDYNYEDQSDDSSSSVKAVIVQTTARPKVLTHDSKFPLASATTRYRYENGRTYHTYRDGEYWGPNDDQMLNHEVIIHHLCLLTLRDRLFLAPIKKPRRILDIGTGRGLWATDMADMFPSAKVIGIDFSLPPPEAQPDNVEFIVDDATSVWAYGDDFDFIHIRGLFGSIADWPPLYAQIFNHLHPGGYLEQIEWSVYQKSDDGTLAPDSVLAEWSRDAVRVGDLNGKTLEIAEKMAGFIREAGFVDVVDKRYKWPIGPWSSNDVSKKIGHWNVKNWEEGMEGWAMALYTRVLGWTAEQVHERIRLARKALRDRTQHVYHEVRLVYARKPDQ